MSKDLSLLAREIIKTNQYMTIGSSNPDGSAWVSPVAYVFDDNFSFYWVSFPDSQHQKNIKQNPNVTISIFDSHQLWGEGVGLQIEANAQEVSLKDLPHAMKLYFSRKYPYGNVDGAFGMGLKELLKGKVYKFYCAIPTRFWAPDPNSDIDSRIEVKPL